MIYGPALDMFWWGMSSFSAACLRIVVEPGQGSLQQNGTIVAEAIGTSKGVKKGGGRVPTGEWGGPTALHTGMVRSLFLGEPIGGLPPGVKIAETSAMARQDEASPR